MATEPERDEPERKSGEVVKDLTELTEDDLRIEELESRETPGAVTDSGGTGWHGSIRESYS
ncbi:MAG: hypothetical protein HYV63_13780 [Candidatus Schekmanbacteria bacterium]|nr:hypothetical protein [Candidatus Schekmanbacteria bacterium]